MRDARQRISLRPRLASPEAYTPQHLAERMINSKAAENGGSVNRPFVVSTLQLPK